MSDLIRYLWLVLFFIVNPLFVFFISRGKKPGCWGMAYMLATVTMVSFLFFGLYFGQYGICLIAVFYLLIAPILVRRKSWRRAGDGR